MTTKLVRWSWVLALPISAVLAAPAERAVEVPLNSTSGPVTRSTTTTKAANAVTQNATVTRRNGKTATRQATPVPERTLSMRSTAPAGADDNGVYHSVHDWVPRTPTKASQTQAQSSASDRPHRTHWWNRPQRAAASQKAEEVTH